MAAVHGPAIASHPSPFRHGHSMARSSIPQVKVNPSISNAVAILTFLKTSQDPYYGHEHTARMCARFVTHLFACPDLPTPPPLHPSTSTAPLLPSPPLARFIAYALHRTRLHASVTFAALYLLQCLKVRFPAAQGSSGHRLFIAAFMIASKVICDDTYSNKSWTIVGQNLYQLREINQMEREMCSYLEWELNIEPAILAKFEGKVKKDFVGPSPYPTYALPPRPSEQPMQPFELNAISIPVIPIPIQKSPPKPVQNPLLPPPVPVKVTYDSRHATNDYMPPLTPDTPSPTFSPVSPATSASPPTPPDGQEIQITDGRYTHLVMMADHAVELKLPKAYPKSKIGWEVFAFAVPAVW
ncbi:hypothetical protein JAAARDRAFT_178726 [Jaapia argillacea MUCL 33604]|uniref:Cyclin N-terminal domain-containing protein n=1 Tax=Jaapia argillacea MUCL 33604 TaxID=933084 RepID=A0A067PTG6_9AGAM|nr:hypothetical protein JAAARDRAFT_178726 [Jaapia argillacea MUCL 33604]